MGVGRGHITCRLFDHDVKYVKTVWPPPANLPVKKLGGMGYVEYEKGARAIQAPRINMGTYRESYWMPGVIGSKHQSAQRPAVMNGRIYLLDSGWGPGLDQAHLVHMLYYLNTDGSTDYEGMKGAVWETGDKRTAVPMLAASPKDGMLYLVGWGGRGGGKAVGAAEPTLMRRRADGEKAEVIHGRLGKPGSDNQSLNGPTDVACDVEGRVYVVDGFNNRVQIVNRDGKYLQTIGAEGPRLIQVHQKTGAVYLVHAARVKGKLVGRLTRYSAFPDLKEEAHWDVGAIQLMTLDSWASKPRLWLASEEVNLVMDAYRSEGGLRVYEDRGNELTKIFDFDEEAARSAGANYAGRWDGGAMNQVYCDPVRERVIYKLRATFDLRTGKYEGWMMGNNPAREDLATALMTSETGGHWGLKVHMGGEISEVTFDKRGYMHAHMGSVMDGVPPGGPITRMIPDRIVSMKYGGQFAEVPYDYGDEWRAAQTDKDQVWTGVIAVPPVNRLGYAWGMGANMRGNIALVMTSMYVPKMDESGFKSIFPGMEESGGIGIERKMQMKYAEFQNTLQNVERQGGRVYFIKREPGVAIQGATIWTFDSSGKVRHQAGVIAGEWNNGVQLDEDGCVYFTNVRPAMKGDKPFLWNKGGNFGGEPIDHHNRQPFNSAYIKTRGHDVRFLQRTSVVPLDTLPQRPPDLTMLTPEGLYHGNDGDTWVKDADWIYAGSGPVVAQHCHCPQMRSHLDWYKRSYVPEAYRHSVGILDANGNLILHLGQYGNFDSGNGPDSLVPLGGDGIATTMIRFVSGTDNYFVIADWGQRLIVTKLSYHAEETAGIGGSKGE
jgi:hypothetical protein